MISQDDGVLYEAGAVCRRCGCREFERVESRWLGVPAEWTCIHCGLRWNGLVVNVDGKETLIMESAFEVNAQHVCGVCGNKGIKVVSTQRTPLNPKRVMVRRYLKCPHCEHRPNPLVSFEDADTGKPVAAAEAVGKRSGRVAAR